MIRYDRIFIPEINKALDLAFLLLNIIDANVTDVLKYFR